LARYAVYPSAPAVTLAGFSLCAPLSKGGQTSSPDLKLEAIA